MLVAENDAEMQDEDGGEPGASGNPLDAYASNLNEWRARTDRPAGWA